MKTQFILLLLIVPILSSITFSKSLSLNSNSWSVKIGTKVILASWKNNELGDLATIHIAKLKTTDTLFVYSYLCGYQPDENTSTILTVKTKQQVTIYESTEFDQKWNLSGNMPLAKLVTSPNLYKNQELEIYFTINSDSTNSGEPLLLGKVVFK